MQKKTPKQSFAERISFSVSLFIVSIIFFLVCFTWITGDNNPPILSVTTSSNIRHVKKQYYLPFTIINSGGETAESVEIVAKLLSRDLDIETGRQQVDFLSRQEKKSGEFIFNHNPTEGKLTIRVASYKLP
ncbi:MAG: TIGR02588 family protein [Pleurocapsa sp.]